MELRCWQAYRARDCDIHFWRTAAGQEVDFIVGEMDLAIEAKGSARVHHGDLRGLHALRQEHSVRRAIIVCLERQPRRFESVEILPWQTFVEQLWRGDLI